MIIISSRLCREDGGVLSAWALFDYDIFLGFAEKTWLFEFDERGLPGGGVVVVAEESGDGGGEVGEVRMR